MNFRTTRDWLVMGASTAVLMAGGGGVAAAQDAPSASAGDEIIVTAQRREQTLTEVPVSVQAFSGSALEQAQVQNVTDLVRISPSVNFSSGFSASSSGFLIRGVSSRVITGTTQPSAAIVVDNMPLARQGEFVAELADIERVEVLRGPQGTLFGKNATAGVLNIVTQSPQDEFGASAQVGYTTDDEASVRAMINAGGGDTWVRVNGFWRDLQPIFENRFPGGEDLGSSDSWGAAIKVNHEFSPNLNWLVTANYRESQNTFGQLTPTVRSRGLAGTIQTGLLGYEPTLDTTHVNVNSPPNNNVQNGGIISELTWDVSDQWTITAISGMRRYQEDVDFDVDSAPTGVNLGGVGGTNIPNGVPYLGYIWAPNTVDGPFNNQGVVDYASQELRVNFSGDRMDFVGGLFYQTLESGGQSGTGLAVNDLAALIAFGATCGTTATDWCFVPATGNEAFGQTGYENDTWAVFGDLTFAVTETVSVFGGLRYTHEEIEGFYDGARIRPNDTSFYNLFDAIDLVTGEFLVTGTPLAFTFEDSFNDLSGRVGAQWEPNANTNFYISYSRAYKGPALDVDNAVSGDTVIIDPEQGIAWEIGAKQRLFDGRLLLNVAIFDQTIEDIQVSTTVPNTIRTELLNAGDLDLQGVEIEFRAALTDNLSIDGGVAYIDAEHVGGENACWIQDGSDPRCFEDPDAPGSYLIELTGLKPQNTPETRYTVNLNYDRQLTFIPFGLSARLGYAWQDEMPGAIDGNPETIVPAYGTLDASITLASDDGHWDLTLFGKNLTDELIISTTAAADGSVSREYNIYGRDYTRYGGVQLRYTY